ncbi:hypothetical protein MELA_02474 [Candidatus Methylomirabilis lanthanidiphila]|uniref:Uncharacterized protein n=1 Tax=Candidatus Methylomirabilis lanthanidiphila TaxID=2211376 RepID=A0A564ZL72_9BACT|nr:hypothetical protein [Candidatus Methylomirabilis lanthanidiphila]VUZ86080.1 hypothetical protein MELA_02474 [Candidatus Methylomirabilis lanthanidiphila]
MRPIRRLTALLALCLLVQMVAASRVRAEETTIGADLSAGAISVIATIVTVPLKLITCAATVALGGTVYGLTMGTSEIIREELVAGTNQTCGGRFYVSPQQVKQLARESEVGR